MQQKTLPKLLWPITVCLVLFWVAYMLISAYSTAQSSGLLVISSSDQKAAITVGETDHEAIIVGQGAAKVRLKPGTYQIVAGDGTKRGAALATLSKNKITHVNVTVATPVMKPTIGNVDFEGTGTFLDQGLTSGQVSSLEQLLFNYDMGVQKVVINTSSIQSGQSADGNFTMSFNLQLDSESYQANIEYGVADNVLLTLNNSSGSTVFTGGGLE
jgi:hypothetical protein